VKSPVFWDVASCSPVKAQFSEEHTASIFRVEA
jgi:hypothetical protein